MNDKSQTLLNLNQYLFDQLERLNDKNLHGDELATEIKRGNAIANMGKVIVDNAELVLRAQMFKDRINEDAELPELLDCEKNG